MLFAGYWLLKVESYICLTFDTKYMRLYGVFIGTEILQLCDKFWLVVAVRYTEVNFNTKVPLVPKGGVRYREVSAITVRYKEVFLWYFDHDFIRSWEKCPL